MAGGRVGDRRSPGSHHVRRPPPLPADPPPASDEELARTLTRLGYEASDDQVADRLVAELLRRPGGEGGRPHPTWKRQLPGLRALAGELVGAARAGHHVSQATLAQQAGLRREGQVCHDGPEVAPLDRGRTTVTRTIHAWEAMGLVWYLDDAGRTLPRFDAEGLPLPRGASFAKGSAPLYGVDVSWTPEMVAVAPAAVRRRAAWAWAALRAGAADQLVALMLSDPCRGEARLRAWCAWHELGERRLRRRERRAASEAAARAGRPASAPRPDPHSAGEWELIRSVVRSEEARQTAERDLGAADQLERARWMLAEHDAEVRAAALGLQRLDALIDQGNCTPPLPPRQKPELVSGSGGGERTPLYPPRGTDRAVKTALHATPNAAQLRLWVLTGLADDTEGAMRQFEAVALAAKLVGEPRPVKAWLGLGHMAQRVGRPVGDLVAEYQQRADEFRGDVQARVRDRQREPVVYPPVFVWRMVRYAVGDLERPAAQVSGWARRSEGEPGDQELGDGDHVEAVDAEPGACRVLMGTVAPQPAGQEAEAPARARSLAELQAIRARASAEYEASKRARA